MNKKPYTFRKGWFQGRVDVGEHGHKIMGMISVGFIVWIVGSAIINRVAGMEELGWIHLLWAVALILIIFRLSHRYTINEYWECSGCDLFAVITFFRSFCFYGAFP